jgi:hypothetical protein
MTLAFTVDPASLVVSNYAHIIQGTRDPSIVSMTVNDATGRITFPTGSTWRLELVLNPGTNKCLIRGADVAGTWTTYQLVEVELPGYDDSPHSFFNTFDDHSLLLGLRRNPGEKNWEYRNRLLAFARARTGAHIEGLFYATAIELGIKPDSRAIAVKALRDSYGGIIGEQVFWQITPVYIYVDAYGLIKTREAHLVEPRTRSIDLDETPRWSEEVQVFDQQDNAVGLRRYDVDIPNRKVVFSDDELNGTWVTVQYPYRYRIDHRAMTLGQLETALEAITIGGQQVLDVVVSDPSLPATGLMRQGRDLLSNNYQYVTHARSQVTPLDDQEWQKSLYNVFGGAYGTSLERFARRAAERSNLGWDNLILDEGYWDIDVENDVLDFLPRLWDPVFGRWRCTQPDSGEYYTLLDYKKYNGYCPNHPGQPLVFVGVPLPDIKSGVCESDSLYGVVAEVAEEL